MKTAISIPDDVFADAESLAKTLNASRSQLYSRAVREFVARHSPERVTAALNEACHAATESDEVFARTAARHALRRSEW